jgi:hypothetical protein
MQTATNGLINCGVIPLHSLVFGEVDLIPDKTMAIKIITHKDFTRKEVDKPASVVSTYQEHL